MKINKRKTKSKKDALVFIPFLGSIFFFFFPQSEEEEEEKLGLSNKNHVI